MKNKILALVLIFAFIGCGVKAQNFKVIVNSSNSISSISKIELSNIFMKKITKFSNGVAAVPVDLNETSSVRDDFSNTVLKKTVSAMKSYWNQQLFSGSGVPPEEKKTEADIVSFVRSNPGAIGYVSSGAVTGDVKVISFQ